MHTNAQTYTDVSLDHSQTEIVFSKGPVNDEKKNQKNPIIIKMPVLLLK